MQRSGLAKLDKYSSLFRINLIHQFAYFTDFLVRTVFLVLILFIFTQLWEVTFAGTGETFIEGFSLKSLLWYLVVTESIILAMPRLVDKVEKEVKNGDIAYFLNRPLSYVAYHYCGFLAEGLLRIVVNLLIGGLLISLIYGGTELSIERLPGLIILMASALTLHFAIVMGICLCSFWVEEVQGYELVYTRMVMILGGMMVPLEIFPGWLQSIAGMLPFPYILYAPAKYAVGVGDSVFLEILMGQWLWIGAFTVVTALVFRWGVSKVHVNGG